MKKLAPRKEVRKRCFEDSSKANPNVRENWGFEKACPKKRSKKRMLLKIRARQTVSTRKDWIKEQPSKANLSKRKLEF